MSRQGAERAVTVSALVVFGVYFYRLLTEGHSTSSGGMLQLGGQGAPPNVGRFITGWGFAFFVLSVITEAAPGFGGSMAILVATGDVLGNAKQVTDDVNKQLGADKKPTAQQMASELDLPLLTAAPTTGPGAAHAVAAGPPVHPIGTAHR
jgi:amino acid transporter